MLLGHLGQERIPMDPPRPQPLRTGPPLGLGPGTSPFAAALTATTPVPTISTVAAAASSATAPFTLRNPLGGDEFILAERTGFELKEVRTFLLLFRGEDLNNLDPVEMELRFDLDDIADFGAFVQ
ncbi:MAG: hypothetical protein AAF531_04760 [Actinomycetota bacterium]